MNYKNIPSIIFIQIFLVSALFAQVENKSSLELTGSLYADSKIISNNFSEVVSNPMADDMPGEKNPVLSGLFSAIVPGAGQVYNEDYWIAGVFVAVEAVLIVTAIHYDNKGDDQTELFQNYADDFTNPDHNWSVVKYADWIIANYYGGEDPGIVVNRNSSLPPWQQVDWTKLNEAERENDVGSHTLYPHGDQQYYEMIGKYHQFAPGWNDFPDNQINREPTPNFLYYSDLRGLANDYYNNASTAVIGVYINHLLSAAEAVWGATRFNNNLAVNLRVENYNIAGGSELVPTLKVKYSF
jgi:hypothetical protein